MKPSALSRLIVIGALLIGLAVRGYVVVQPPASSMLWDHHEYVRWGVLMHEEGFASLYDHAPHESLMWSYRHDAAGRARHPEHFIRRVCNYPPLAGLLLYAEMKTLYAFDPTLTSNTLAARVIYALLSIIGDGLIAVGCLAIVRRLASALAGALAFAVIMLAPPFILDSARWTQTDSWILAALVWVLWAMLAQRWWVAGLLWGVGLGLKTQAILFAPVWAFAFVLGPRRWRIIAAVGSAVLVLFVPSLPFTLHSGLKWFEESYTNNLFEAYKLTTLKAFNVWYVDLLLCDDLDASKELIGLQKDAWGKLLLTTALIASAVLVLRRRAAHRAPLLIFTAVALLAVVMLPTRVHERYIVLPIPFLVMAALERRLLWLALMPFLAAATFQMLALDWLGRSRGAGSWPDVLEWNKSQYLQKYAEQYEDLRAKLPPDQFAQLLPPEQELEKRCREEYARLRAEVAPEEWALTIVELLSAGGLFVLLLTGPSHGPRSSSSSHSSSSPSTSPSSS
ncbi:MAG: glycosyltransferase family 87 protein [Planctomycetota bacterium]